MDLTPIQSMSSGALRLRLLALAVTLCGLGGVASAQVPAPRLVRSLSGPSGKIVGSQFVFDETRSRFVYPQDRTLTVYFEWESTPGDHVLTATWKMPDGRIASVSPDVKIQTTSTALNCFWIFNLAPENPNGAWTVEVRIDGQPAGSHAFELAGLDATAGRWTLDRVFTTYSPAVVRVHKIDETGRRMDSSGGFVIALNAVATAFQSIDAAAILEVEFADGRKVRVNEVLAMSRSGDWAVLSADTQSTPALPRGDAKPTVVGSRLAAFSVDAGTSVIVPVDVGGVSPPAGYGGRIRFAPSVPAGALGGPLIDDRGNVVGILGGSLMPGARLDPRTMEQYPWLFHDQSSTSATVIAAVPVPVPAAPKTLADLRAMSLLTPPIAPMPEFVSGGAATELPKDANNHIIRDRTEFSARDDAQINVYGYWLKKAKLSKGELSGAVFDAENQVRVTIAPKKITLTDQQQRVAFAISPKGLTPGYYRIDVCWDGKPAWRLYVHITD
jgi:S1-C subfamily serine protease